MKNLLIIQLIAITAVFSSCLNSNLEDLPEFENNEITGIQRVEYRFESDDISNASGQNIVKFVELTRVVNIDKDNSKIDIKVTVPAVSNSFPEKAREQCTSKNIAVMVALSTAARLAPVGNSPKLGVAGDWSQPNKYEVTAANGSKQIWTIEVAEFNK